MIVVSEIGDKTFLIAAILAMRQSRSIVFSGAFGALALMSVLSAFMGVVLPTLLPRSVTTLMAALLFFVFGVKMLHDGMRMTGDEMGEEWEEAKREVEQVADEADRMEMRDLEEGYANGDEDANAGNGHARPGIGPSPPSRVKARKAASTFSVAGLKEGTRNLCGLCFSPIFAHAFVLTFLGEWGDRSQIATIALAAAHVGSGRRTGFRFALAKMRPRLRAEHRSGFLWHHRRTCTLHWHGSPGWTVDRNADQRQAR